MSARSIWSGTLSLGIVSVGVKAYKATDEPSAETSMRQLHGTCNHPINQTIHCNHCKTDIAYSDIVKGVEVAKDTFVVLSKEELDSIRPDSTETIVVESFIDVASIDPLYVASSYFLAPDKGQAQAYVLLHAAMVQKGKAAQARFTIYGREHIATIRTMGSGLVLQLMRSKNEVRDMSVLPTFVAPGAVLVDPAQLALAGRLVDMYAGTFDVTQYEDQYVADFKALVASKVAGQPVPVKAGTVAAPKTVDLMAALKASLAVKAPKKLKKAA